MSSVESVPLSAKDCKLCSAPATPRMHEGTGMNSSIDQSRFSDERGARMIRLDSYYYRYSNST